MITALAGGVGGARLAAGLADALPPGGLCVIVNTADDFEHLGLAISPDLDTVMYTLAGLENAVQGWGLGAETWSFMAAMERLGGDTWFRLGDRDLATHIERSRRLAAGETLSTATAALARALGVRALILPMSDDRVRTVIESDEGVLEFQHYFVRRRCEPRLVAVWHEGSDSARAAPGCLQALADPALDAIVICPSNPFVSVAPMLSIDPLRCALQQRRVPLVAVSPIVGGKAIKGPAAKMMAELGIEPSALGIANYYLGRSDGPGLDGIVIDEADRALAADIAATGLTVHVTDTIMRDAASRRRLAEETLAFARGLGNRAAVPLA